MQTVISDTSPIIILAKTNSLNLFSNIFDKIFIPQSVYRELTLKNDIVFQRLKDANFISVLEAKNSDSLMNLYTILDMGEAEAIVLAKELDLPLIIDEKKGRNVAKDFNLKIIGFLGILLINYQKDFVKKNDIFEILNQAEEFGYRLSEKLKGEFLKNL